MNLVKVWKKVQPIDWELHIYGPDYHGHKIEINKIKHHKDNIFIHDAIYDSEIKTDLFKSFDLFILPSKNENFGYVILESLSCGLPVLTTNKTPWEDIKNKNAGWIINDDENELLRELKKILNTNEEDFINKSKNAIDLAKKYLWENLTKNIYQFINEWLEMIKI